MAKKRGNNEGTVGPEQVKEAALELAGDPPTLLKAINELGRLSIGRNVQVSRRAYPRRLGRAIRLQMG